MTDIIRTRRLNLTSFVIADADEVFRCITPAVTKFMSWDVPTYGQYIERCKAKMPDLERTEFRFVIRVRDTAECLGTAAIENLDDVLPEMGLWLKESAQGQGYGREAMEALAIWASMNLDKEGFIYPVALENNASRRVAEGLKGQIIATRQGRKYESVVYKIPSFKPA